MTNAKKHLKNRMGQSLTSTVIGIAILGIVGVAAASLISAQRTSDSAISASADVAALMDSYASRIRSTTRYSEIESTFGAGGAHILRRRLPGQDQCGESLQFRQLEL